MDKAIKATLEQESKDGTVAVELAKLTRNLSIDNDSKVLDKEEGKQGPEEFYHDDKQ